MTTHLTLMGTFSDPHQESRFRAETLNLWRTICGAISLIMFLAMAVLIVTEASTAAEAAPTGARAFVALFALCSLGLTLFSRKELPIYLAIYGLFIVGTVAAYVIDSSRPPEYSLHLGLDLMIILCTYLIIPTRLIQLILAITFSTSLLWLHFTVKEPVYPMAHNTVVVSIFLANFLGFFISVLTNRSRRALFVERQQEEEAAAMIRENQAAISTLTELLPMCANCKKVRDDDGYWNKVETYLASTTGSEVSADLCPDCSTAPGTQT